MTASQRAIVAAGLLEYERKQAALRKAANGGDKRADRESLPSPVPERARDKAGERVGVSGRMVDDAEKVIKGAAPQVVER